MPARFPERHPGFKLLLTAEPSDAFPIALLHACTKVCTCIAFRFLCVRRAVVVVLRVFDEARERVFASPMNHVC